MEKIAISMILGAFCSIAVVLYIVTIVALLSAHPLLAVIFAVGPIIGYLSTKPEWVTKMWKQKEYRE